jgi:rod shape determining protein RodA
MLVQPVRLRLVPWGLVCSVLLLTCFGVSQVISACWDPGHAFCLGRESAAQLEWWCLGLITCAAVAHVSLAAWRGVAWVLYAGAFGVVVLMIGAAGTALVPEIKGQANWIVLGPMRVQPVEFIKFAALLATARVLSSPGFDARKLSDSLKALMVPGALSAALAKGDMGSALTFIPMAFGMVYAAGMQVRWVITGAVAMVLLGFGVVHALPHDGYQYKRVQAWLHPDEYALTEGYQTQRSMSAIGSGQWVGKGYAAGDQNRLGWVPEKHTDLILAVAGEELGFLGAGGAMALFIIFAWAGLTAAAQCRDPCGRYVICGYVCLLCGQASINIAVATGLMPVTGVTLPFFSYGGSSLLGSYLGLGLAISCCAAPRRSAGTHTTFTAPMGL